MSVPAVSIDPVHLRIHHHRHLGSGSLGAVCEGEYLNHPVAVKTLRGTLSEPQRVAVLHEVAQHAAWTRQDQAHVSPHVLRVYGVVPKRGGSQIVMEFASRRNLAEFLSSQRASRARRARASAAAGGQLQVEGLALKLQLLVDAGKGLASVHELGRVHGNVAARNVLVHELRDGGRSLGYVAKVGDFGYAHQGVAAAGGQSFAQLHASALPWMAPECVAEPHEFTSSSDVFAFGVLMYEVFAGKAPYAGAQPDDLAQRIMGGETPGDLPADVCPPRAMRLMQQCWAASPASRPSVEHVVAELSAMLGPDARNPDVFKHANAPLVLPPVVGFKGGAPAAGPGAGGPSLRRVRTVGAGAVRMASDDDSDDDVDDGDESEEPQALEVVTDADGVTWLNGYPQHKAWQNGEETCCAVGMLGCYFCANVTLGEVLFTHPQSVYGVDECGECMVNMCALCLPFCQCYMCVVRRYFVKRHGIKEGPLASFFWSLNPWTSYAQIDRHENYCKALTPPPEAQEMLTQRGGWFRVAGS